MDGTWRLFPSTIHVLPFDDFPRIFASAPVAILNIEIRNT
jgi:hypothetical protein